MNDHERSAFRAFVREHHPDRGGDPELFVAGLSRFGVGADKAGGDRAGGDKAGGDRSAGSDGSTPDDHRYDAPIEVVGPLPFPVRVGVALIRTWRRHRRHRVQ